MPLLLMDKGNLLCKLGTEMHANLKQGLRNIGFLLRGFQVVHCTLVRIFHSELRELASRPRKRVHRFRYSSHRRKRTPCNLSSVLRHLTLVIPQEKTGTLQQHGLYFRHNMIRGEMCHLVMMRAQDR